MNLEKMNSSVEKISYTTSIVRHSDCIRYPDNFKDFEMDKEKPQFNRENFVKNTTISKSNQKTRCVTLQEESLENNSAKLRHCNIQSLKEEKADGAIFHEVFGSRGLTSVATQVNDETVATKKKKCLNSNDSQMEFEIHPKQVDPEVILHQTFDEEKVEKFEQDARCLFRPLIKNATLKNSEKKDNFDNEKHLKINLKNHSITSQRSKWIPKVDEIVNGGSKKLKKKRMQNKNSCSMYPQADMIVSSLNENDILCGRGSLHYDYVGNVKFRELATKHRNRSLESSSKSFEKDKVAKTILDEICSMDPQGRFLEKTLTSTKSDPVYRIITEEKALEKVKQALRFKNRISDIISSLPQAAPSDKETNLFASFDVPLKSSSEACLTYPKPSKKTEASQSFEEDVKQSISDSSQSIHCMKNIKSTLRVVERDIISTVLNRIVTKIEENASKRIDNAEEELRLNFFEFLQMTSSETHDMTKDKNACEGISCKNELVAKPSNRVCNSTQNGYSLRSDILYPQKTPLETPQSSVRISYYNPVETIGQETGECKPSSSTKHNFPISQCEHVEPEVKFLDNSMQPCRSNGSYSQLQSRNFDDQIICEKGNLPDIERKLNISTAVPSIKKKTRLVSSEIKKMSARVNCKLKYEPSSKRLKTMKKTHINCISYPQADTIVTVLNENDILSGRGSLHYDYVGNVKFRELVSNHREKSLDAHSKSFEKDKVAKQIIDEICSMDPQGRFLEKTPTSSKNDPVYRIIAEDKALEKVKQALRFKSRPVDHVSPLTSPSEECSSSKNKNVEIKPVCPLNVEASPLNILLLASAHLQQSGA